MLPRPGKQTLDIGCGEGRVTRDLAELGHRTIGIDSSPTLIRYASQAHPAGHYLLADAAALPFPEATFDLVVAYCSLMDIDDMPAAVAEAARMLEGGGRFCFCVTHPVADAGNFTSSEADAPFVIGTYFGPRHFEGGTFERDGLKMTFRGWCHSLEEYSMAIEDAGARDRFNPRAESQRRGHLQETVPNPVVKGSPVPSSARSQATT